MMVKSQKLPQKFASQIERDFFLSHNSFFSRKEIDMTGVSHMVLLCFASQTKLVLRVLVRSFSFCRFPIDFTP